MTTTTTTTTKSDDAASANNNDKEKVEQQCNNYDLLLDRLSENVQQYPTKLALSFLSSNGSKIIKQLTYEQLQKETDELATRLLLSEGIKPGDKVVLVYPPSLDFTVAFISCLKAGIVAVPVFPPHPTRNRDTLQMFAGIVNGCNAKYALTNTDYDYVKKMAGIKDTFIKNKNKNAGGGDWPEDLKWIVTDTKTNIKKKKKKKGSSAAVQTPTTNNNNNITNIDLAFLQYTSGSTSSPKGVMITHQNLGHNLTIITNELGASDDTVVVSWLPQYHDMGLIGSVLGVLYCGGTGYYLSPITFLQNPMVWLELVSKYRATHLQAPNFAFKLCCRKLNKSNYYYESNKKDSSQKHQQLLDLSSVQHVINAAEPVDVDSISTFYKTFEPYGFPQKDVIYPTYGLAEHTVFVCSGGKQILTVLKKELEVDGKVVVVSFATASASANNNNNNNENAALVSNLVGCGYPANQNVTVRIVTVNNDNNNNFHALGEDTVGEIWVRSPSKAAGYYEKELETKEDFHAKLDGGDNDNDDGYLRTGDLGFLHNDELFICGRLKDLIIVGGRNYYPQDIEATAESSSAENAAIRPGCSAAFTIDPTHEGGEEVALVMELKDVPTSKDSIKNVCLPLANQIRSSINQEHSLGISEIAFLETRTVPKTSSGKIARALCRKGFVAGTLKIVYRLSFKSDMSPLEIETGEGNGHASGSNGRGAGTSNSISPEDALKIRELSKSEILSKLTTDVSRVGSIPPDSVNKDTALVAMLDSLTISQLKGMLENNYAVKLSDEYLFRDTTTLTKLVEVVKLGYAPDDDGDVGGGQAATSGSSTAAAHQPVGTATGLAGALGCPPGVVCAIL